MTKVELLESIDLAINNDAYLFLEAGDYFTDYYRLIKPRTLNNFKDEVYTYGTEVKGLYGAIEIKMNSVDNLACGAFTGEINQYYIRKAKPVVPEEVEALISYLQ